VVGATDMGKGFDGLSVLVQTVLHDDPFSSQLSVCAADAVTGSRVPWWNGQGLCLNYKRLERGRSIWPRAQAATQQSDV